MFARSSRVWYAIVPLLLVAGIWLGGHPGLLPGFLRTALTDESAHADAVEARVVDEALDIIERDYYRPVDRRALLNVGLEAAVKSLDDRFSAYFDPKTFDHFEEASSGQFEGVGMTVQANRRGLEVVSTFAGSPARDAGIKPGDVIVSANGRSLAGESTSAATALIKGKSGTEVTLRVRADQAERTVRVKRQRVDVPSVESELVRTPRGEVAHVTLSGFTSGAHGEVGAAVRGLLGKGADAVVLDLRNNGGGYLDEAVLVSSLFIPEGTIVSTRRRNGEDKVYSASGPSIAADVPVVVLVNRGTASSSEIVSGAIQDRKRGVVVGTATFGKGVFQQIEQLSNGGALDITVGEYFTPNGRNLGGGGPKRGAGIQPDVVARDRARTKRDEALRVAVRTALKSAR